MILSVFCVRDRATDQFGTPMFLVSTGQAIRSFGDEVNRADKDNQLFRHPEDFDLYLFGTFDSSSGEFVIEKKAVQVAIGKDLVVQQ